MHFIRVLGVASHSIVAYGGTRFKGKLLIAFDMPLDLS
jgi:hypothetical protein